MVSSNLQFSQADTLYAAALGAVHGDTTVEGELSAVGRMALDAAWGAFEGPIVQVAEELGLRLLSEGLGMLPPTVLAEVAGIAGEVAGAVGAIGEMVPVIGAIISLVNTGIQLSEAQDAQIRQRTTGIAQSLLSRPVSPSGADVGKGPVVQPSDIVPTDPNFVGDPFPGVSTWLGVDPIPPMPSTSLGITLAALTEGQPSHGPHLGDDAAADSTLRHTDNVWHYARGFYHAQNPDLPPEELRLPLGVPKAYRHLFQVVRLAIGSRNVDQGRILWPIYMDLLVNAWDRGWLSGTFATWMLSHKLRADPDGWAVDTDDTYAMADAPEANAGAPATAWVPYVDQIIGLVNAWRAFRNAPPKVGPIHIKIKRPRLTLTPLHLAGLLKVPSSSSSSSSSLKKTAAEQAAIDAYAAALGLPPGHY